MVLGRHRGICEQILLVTRKIIQMPSIRKAAIVSGLVANEQGSVRMGMRSPVCTARKAIMIIR